MRTQRGGHVLLVAMLLAALATPARATGSGSAADPQTDPAPCLAAAAAADDPKTIERCSALADNPKVSRADRVKLLVARGGAYDRSGDIRKAIADYGAALQLDPSQADVFNARGELWRRLGDRRKALEDFGAALRLNADHAAAKANYKALALELERLGALMAAYSKPSFNCPQARRPLERAVCGNPELVILDREINAVHAKLLRDQKDNRRVVEALQREQSDFVAARNAAFGRPDYDLLQDMRRRLDRLLALEQGKQAVFN